MSNKKHLFIIGRNLFVLAFLAGALIALQLVLPSITFASPSPAPIAILVTPTASPTPTPTTAITPTSTTRTPNSAEDTSATSTPTSVVGLDQTMLLLLGSVGLLAIIVVVVLVLLALRRRQARRRDLAYFEAEEAHRRAALAMQYPPPSFQPQPLPPQASLTPAPPVDPATPLAATPKEKVIPQRVTPLNVRESKPQNPQTKTVQLSNIPGVISGKPQESPGADAKMAGRVDQRFGDYHLLRFLGEGTFGDVYLGEHAYKKTLAAVKVFKTRLTPDKLKDFVTEVRTVLLRHPNIVQILDFGIGEGDIPFLVMEYAPNGTLRQRYPKGAPLPLPSIIAYVKQIAAALQYAHDERRIHRDIKPENILFGASNQILLSDFGIAVVAHSPSSQRTEDAIGTARYMAPEQWQGKPLPATDQYALGIIVYEWLCGECPFDGGTLQLMYQHLQAPPPPLRSKVPTISPNIEQVVLTALAKDPQQRFARIQAFAIALEQAYQSTS